MKQQIGRARFKGRLLFEVCKQHLVLGAGLVYQFFDLLVSAEKAQTAELLIRSACEHISEPIGRPAMQRA